MDTMEGCTSGNKWKASHDHHPMDELIINHLNKGVNVMLTIDNFQYNTELKWYESSLDIKGITTKIYVLDNEIKEKNVLNNQLKKGINWVEDNFEEIKTYCADNLLELKNESWADNEEEQVTEEEFKKLLLLESITIQPSGSLELTFQDGDLFYGHFIVVKTDSEYQLNYADIEG